MTSVEEWAEIRKSDKVILLGFFNIKSTTKMNIKKYLREFIKRKKIPVKPGWKPVIVFQYQDAGRLHYNAYLVKRKNE